MRRVVLLLALAAVCACTRTSERAFATTFRAAKDAVQRGELTEARALAERGAARAAPETPWSWKFRFLRGEILLLQRQPAGVPGLVDASLPPGAAFDALRARQAYLAALLARSRNRLADALAFLESGRRFAGGDPDVSLDMAWLQGQLELRLGRWSAGETRLDGVVTQALARGDRFQAARALNDMGMGDLARKRWDEAIPRFERIRSLRDLEATTPYASALTNAGICYAKLGEFDRAIAILGESVKLHTGRGTRADYAQALAALGNTFFMKGDTPRALPLLRQAFDVDSSAQLKADAILIANDLAAAYVSLEQWDEAARFNEQARRLAAETGGAALVYTTLDAARIAEGRGQLDEAQRLFEQALDADPASADVRWSAHAGLAHIALAQRAPDRAARHFEAALDAVASTRADLAKIDYKLTFLTRLIPFYQEYVDALVDQAQVARALEVSESSRARVLTEGTGLAPLSKVTFAAIQRTAARSHAVLVSYWLGLSRSYAFVVTSSGVRCVRLPPAREIEALVRQHEAVVGNGLADPLAASNGAGNRLYHLLVDPLAPALTPGAHITIAADGALHALNFETLPVATPKPHYWIEDVEIQMTPGLSLLNAPPAQSAPPSLLLVGNAAAHPPDYPTLKFASAEMANVSRNFPPDRTAVYDGARASPASYRGAKPDQYAYVHFTAHAAANIDSPLDSAVILSGPDGAYKLYARDVAALPLRAQLVTVSACRSAGERAYSGEGLVGFAWAFLRAGASRVIAGLWDVDDRSTADLMGDLYTRIAAGASPADALRRAKLAAIARGGTHAKPYYWGPFELFTVAQD
jgi:CHAT domain-containing protein